MLKIKLVAQFKKDLKKFTYNPSIISELDRVIQLLAQSQELPQKYKNHNLSGHWKGYRECHVKPDALLIYHIDTKEKILTLIRFGSHSELFT